MSPPPVEPPRGVSRSWPWVATIRQVLANRGFVACVLLLGTLVVAFEVLAAVKDIQFRKLPVPLRKPLGLLDQMALRERIFTLDADRRSHLYAGPPSLPIVEAFRSHGFALGPKAEALVKEPGRRWEISDSDERTKAGVTYRIEQEGPEGRLSVFAPYRLLSAVEIKPEILDSLGTDQYIQWLLLDESRPGDPQPEQFIQLFVTYYTGAPDQVPHVPEECYIGGGGYTVKTESYLDIPLPALGPDQRVPVKLLELVGSSSAARGTKIVMYVFHTNGRFCPDRTCVRQALADPFVRHAYFSKLEVTFGVNDALPTPERAIETGRRFLGVAIPLLVKDHWPDWEQVLRDEREARSAGRTHGN